MTGARVFMAIAALVAATPAFAAKKQLATGERIDLSRASVAELMRLPSVGRRKAEAIVALRARAPLRRVEDLLSVKGVSSAWLEKQRAHLVVSATAPAPKAAPAPRGR